VRYSPSLQSSLLRAFTFTFFVSGVWSLLAVVAHRDMHQGALGYGILNGSLGSGAVVAATALGRVRRRFGADRIIAAATLYMVFTLGMLAKVHTPAIIIPVLIAAGFAWTSTMATLNTSVQLAVPAWVQARALGTYLMTFQGGLALGSITWGFVAEHFSTPVALLAAGAGLLVTLPFVHRFKILQGPVPDHTPYQWKNPAPQLAGDSEPTAGPVRVSVEYVIPVEQYAAFTRAIHELRGVRLRDGAIRWGIFRDASDPEKLNETFVMESWLDYLRSRERMTTEDVAIRERVYAMNKGGERPKVSHQIYAREVAGG
jgi:MFS family permease